MNRARHPAARDLFSFLARGAALAFHEQSNVQLVADPELTIADSGSIPAHPNPRARPVNTLPASSPPYLTSF